MANESKGSGSGLGALLGAEPRASASRGGGRLPLSYMRPGPFQPRREMQREPLEELAASIKASGVIQPIVLRPLPPGSAGEARYEIIAGERRWQAAKLAGLTDIPVVVRELSDGQALAVALIENIQREELTPAEEARALQRLAEEFHLTHEAVGKAVGRSRAAVSNLIRLLELPDEILALIDAKRLSMGHARALIALEEDAARVRLARTVAERGLSVRATEELVRRALEGKGTAQRTRRSAAVREVLKAPGVRVKLHQRPNGAGRIVVDFADPEVQEVLVQGIKEALNKGNRGCE